MVSAYDWFFRSQKYGIIRNYNITNVATYSTFVTNQPIKSRFEQIRYLLQHLLHSRICIRSGIYAEELTVALREIRRRSEADRIGDLLDCEVGMTEQFLRFTQAHLTNQLNRGYPEQ